MNKLLNILIVEDSASDAGLVARHIERAGYEVRWARVDAVAALEAAVEKQTWDVVLCDYSMPSFNGLDALALVRATGNDVPFIFVSGTMGEDTAVQAMKAGAQDYVVKGRLQRLVPAIERELHEARGRQHQRQSELAMIESEHKYRQLFESLSDAAFLFDLASRRIIDTNRQAEVLLELAREKIVGLTFGASPGMESLGKVLRQFEAGAGTGAPNCDAEILRANKTITPVLVSLTAITLYGRRLVMALLRDVTERNKLEEQFRHSQKMEGIGQLAAGVAHDFNNLLAVIRGNAELVLTDGAMNAAEAGHHLKQVIIASERAAGLTRQLLMFSRRQTLHLQPLNLNETVRNLAGMLRRIIGEDINLQCDHAARLPLIYADIGMVEQVVLNLVVNARDAMPRGGEIIVRTSEELFGPDCVRCHPQAKPGNYACLSVTDTGCGIPPEILARIFEPFFTTKDVGKGTGLGLATAYGIVQQHHGWMTVHSVVGAGSTFRVYLPVADRLAVEPVEPVAVKPSPGGTETILLVEDESALRTLVRNILERYGYTVLETVSAVEALKVWRDFQGRIQLVLTDLVMPGGMTGRELVAQLELEGASLPAMYMSGYSADVVGGNDLQEGINFLKKPFQQEDLLRAVRGRLEQPVKSGGAVTVAPTIAA